jgi:hypothetical protein
VSRDGVIQSFLAIGLDRITRGKAGFINFGRNMLLEAWYDLLNPATVVVELPNDVRRVPAPRQEWLHPHSTIPSSAALPTARHPLNPACNRG